MKCESDGSPGWKFGPSGQCYTYAAGDAASEAAAKKKAIRQALAIGGGKLPADFSEFDDALETVDLEGVEVMRAGGPFFGQGSPPEGDFFSVDDLKRIAEDSDAVVEETKPPNKIGHSFQQALVKNSGLTDGEMPALGWLANFRADGDRVLADIRRVPKMFSKLIAAGAFRTRSPELSPFVSRKTGATYNNVIRGLSWQGAKPVAITTLQDVVNLYTDAAVEDILAEGDKLTEEGVRSVDYDLVETRDAFVLTFDQNNAATVIPMSQWVTITTTSTGTVGEAAAADTRLQMPETKTIEFSDEQIVELREKLGLAEDAEASQVFEALDELKTKAETPAPPPPPDGGSDGGTGTPEGGQAQLPEGMIAMEADEAAELRQMAEAGRDANEKLRVRDREDFLRGAMSKGKIDPAQVEEFRKDYDENEDLTRRLIDRLPERENEVLGSDDPGTTEGEAAEDDRLYEELAAWTGVFPARSEA